MYEDFEEDEDDIFNSGPDVDASSAFKMEGIAATLEKENLKEDKMDEFNEPTYYEEDLLSLQGYDDETSHVYANFN